jgi:hypothetical protein
MPHHLPVILIAIRVLVSHHGGAFGSDDLQRPSRAAANRVDSSNQPFVLLLA